jgi:thiamine pyrophosphate-dependent acetolactate synthase large subunit-like protein
MTMTLHEALEPVAGHRGPRVVIPTMASVAEWPQLSDTALDFSYIPSSMGQGPALGLGIALARPDHGAIVLCGDGSLLMNLGCLVTIASHPAPLWLIVLDNGLYEVTGGQPVAGSRRTDFASLAKAAGIGRTYTYEDPVAWESHAGTVFSGDGPVFVWLKIEARYGQTTPGPPRPMPEQIRRLQEALKSAGP